MKTYFRRKDVLFGAWCFLSIGLFILVVGIPATANELRLRFGGATIQAEVTDWRVHIGKFGTSYDVRYMFRVPGKPVLYTATDPAFLFWRQDLWRSIPSALWEETKNTRAIDVRYLPTAPEANRPEASSDLADVLVGISVGAVSCAIALFAFCFLRHGWIN